MLKDALRSFSVPTPAEMFVDNSFVTLTEAFDLEMSLVRDVFVSRFLVCPHTRCNVN